MNEITLINKYLKPLAFKNKSSLKLSDDIYYDSKTGLCVSVDTYVEGVHFFNSSNPKKFLKRTLRASLSDFYCKGVNPTGYFLSIGLNKKKSKHSWLKDFKNILHSEQKKFNILLSGGDTTFSHKFTITFIIIGYSKKLPVFRKTCFINDDIYITGDIGNSYLGLCILKKKENFGKYNKFFKKKYFEPELSFKFSRHLKKIASASIDVSDGLGIDLNRLCNESKCGAVIDLQLLPFSSIVKKMLNKKRLKVENIFSNGDDYQILFTSNQKNRSKIKSLSKKTSTKISRIGFIKKGKDITFNNKNKSFIFNHQKAGYIHTF